MRIVGLDLTGVGTLAGGVGTLAGAGAAYFVARSACGRHLEQCEDRLGDLETTVGILLSLLPGGELAEQFQMYRRDRDADVSRVLEATRKRWKLRHGFV